MSKKILIIAPAWVGDLIIAHSLIQTLAQLYPDCAIALLAPQWSVDIAKRMSHVHEIFELPIGHGELALSLRFKLAKKLKENKYQQVLVLPGSFKSALIPFFAQIPVRTGWLRELRFVVLNDWRPLNKQKYPSIVMRYNALAYPKNYDSTQIKIYLPKLSVDTQNIASLRQQFALSFAQGQSVLALCPGAAFGPAKRWPVAHFAAVASAKLQQGWQVWLFGSAADQPVIEEIVQLLPSSLGTIVNFAGKINLLQTIDLLSLVNTVISNDSGLLHMAASLGVKVIGIYGSTSPVMAPPLSHNSQVFYKGLACSPCAERTCPLKHFNCMKQISSAEVLAAI